MDEGRGYSSEAPKIDAKTTDGPMQSNLGRAHADAQQRCDLDMRVTLHHLEDKDLGETRREDCEGTFDHSAIGQGRLGGGPQLQTFNILDYLASVAHTPCMHKRRASSHAPQPAGESSMLVIT